MELELLKEIWQKTAPEQQVSLHTGTDVLPGTASSRQKIISRLRRNLFIEVIIVLVCVSAIAFFYFTAFNGNFKEVSWMYIALAVFFLVYYYQKNKLFTSLQSNTLAVKAHLEHRLSVLERYIRFYLLTGTLLVPVLMGFFYALVFYKHIIIFPSLQLHIGSANFTFAYIVFSFLLTIVLYYLYRWYIYKLYGKHIERLKTLLNEMNEEN